MANLKLKNPSGGSLALVSADGASDLTVTFPAGTGTAVVNGVSSAIVSGTAVATTSGTSIDFTGIPSWVKRITIMFNGVSTSGTARVMIQLGDSGGVETSGYASGSYYLQSSASNNFLDGPNGFVIFWDEAAAARYGVMQISLLNASTNLWSQFGNFGIDGVSDGMAICAGTKSLSATLDRIRITTTNGTDTFDAGSINILYE
jgi:hypothetical protein